MFCDSCVRGMEMAEGGRKMGSSTPNWQAACADDIPARQEECAVSPHHWHLIPVRHSALQQALRHRAHLLLLGRLPSWKWCVVPRVDSLRDLPGSYVALSTQLGTANSWHMSCT